MTPFIVAELSSNHLGSLDRALAIVEAAAHAGADAIKLQTWSPGTMCIDKGYRLDSGPWKGRSLFDLYEQAFTPWEWHPILFDAAKKQGIECFSAPFDKAAVDFLETLNCPRYKIASFELTDLPLIRHVASKGKPMILSTGMATDDEIDAAYDATGDVRHVTIVKCTSGYPSDASDANLATMEEWAKTWEWDIGLSDHSEGIGVAVAAAALGATYIEKHLTLNRRHGGLDCDFSMEPDEFAWMVIECRRAAAAIGEVKYGPTSGEDTRLRRSWWVKRVVRSGDVITEDDVCTARPALGLSPAVDVIGRIAAIPLFPGEPLTAQMLVPRET